MESQATGHGTTGATRYRVSDAARYLGVSSDTVRRWIAGGTLTVYTDSAGRTVLDGLELARLARDSAVPQADPRQTSTSVANRFFGIVTDVRRGPITSLVEIQAGPHRVQALVGTDAVDYMSLVPGIAVITSALATSFSVERLSEH